MVDIHNLDNEAMLSWLVNACSGVLVDCGLEVGDGAEAAAKGLIAAKLTGSIINVSSQMGHVGGPERTVYCATKHALEGASKAMVWELGAQGIRVDTICLTFIKSPMTAGMLADSEFLSSDD